MAGAAPFQFPTGTSASMAPTLATPIGLSTTYEDGSAGDQSSAPPAFQSAPDAMATREQEITTLARQLSRQTSNQPRPSSPLNLVRQLTGRSNATVVADSPEKLFKYEQGSDLDPFSPDFNARKYVKGIAGLSEEAGVQRSAGVSYKNMAVHGFGSDADYQKTVGNLPLAMVNQVRDLVSNRKRKVQILHGVDGVLETGEMLVVLGPPGSGCTTLLKTISGETNGLYISEQAEMNYRGITPQEMAGQFRGEAIYTAEVDVHFPNLTVGQTLAFAAEARAPRTTPGGLTRQEFAKHSRDVMMSVFGIPHTMNTIVGNDFIRGVSGGERKRVTICEAALSGAPLQCWDNSTRGLDSANAIEFVKNLRVGAEFLGTTSVVAIYQAPQSAYDLFDKVCVLYEGEQIFFGRIGDAKQYFLDMGFQCPDQQTVPDFLTSLTSASERTPKQGMEHEVPQTPAQFAARWKQSRQYEALMAEIAEFEQKHPVHGERYDQFLESRRIQQSKSTRAGSPYTISYMQQIKLCLRRGFWRLKADPSLTITQLFGNVVMSLIISSVFFNLQPTTASFYQRGALLFFAILINAFGAALEILTLYAQRPIVEKHTQYAFYHSSAEAFASMACDMPYKILNAILSNLTLYFMTNLRREPGPFFFYLFVSFIAMLTMSMIFRSIAALSRQFVSAMTPAAIIMVGLIIYAGFAIPITLMRGWARWINYINPIGYALESLFINEFHDREFTCSQFVPSGPGYENIPATAQACAVQGAQLGQNTVNGDIYIQTAYAYEYSHKWRNVGIIFGFMIFFLGVYLVATEFISAQKSKGEILVFPRGQIPKSLKSSSGDDAESQTSGQTKSEKKAAATGSSAPVDAKIGADKVDSAIIQKQTATFSWKDVVYDIKIKGEARRILDHVDGWVKPGTLTALMGVSGAGKTTLLDVLATRVTMGVVTGEVLVDGSERDVSFQRKTGYVQQQDLHLNSSTVREALQFSALLRQPKHVPKQEKLDYVEEVLKLLEMDGYGNAIVGTAGEGLNVEQRKRLTIGVELVAKPALLLFLDEPTSGLDSQTSWNILQLLRKLTAAGQAILCTIHQPSAILFENFDRLLFLAKGGRTVYFGEVGTGSHILIDYFVRNGSAPFPKGENPAEVMLAVIGAAPGTHTDIDWVNVWNGSEEKVKVREELEYIKETRQREVEEEKRNAPAPSAEQAKIDKDAYKEFAASTVTQGRIVLKRVFQQYWRTPSYIYAKFLLSIAVALFVGFSFFNADTSQAGLQSQLFSAFLIFLMFSQLLQQTLPNFVTQRALFEVREKNSKTYSWKIFVLSNLFAELPYAILVGTVFFFCWYYPIGYYRNAGWTNAIMSRGATMWLIVVEFFLFTSTFAIAIIAGMESAEVAGNLANLMFSLCLIFCGVLVQEQNLPRFWIFMLRVSPFTYFVEAILGVAVAQAPAVCADSELVRVIPPTGTCGDFLGPYQSFAGGTIVNPQSTSECQFCSIANTDVFLAQVGISFDNRWRDIGIIWAYIIFNVFAAIFLYWLARVPKKSGKESGSKPHKQVKAIEGEKV